MNIIKNDELDSFDRIGWFQVQLLLQLVFQPKYGYEIINDLKLNNINISTGQIYPALKKLVNSGHLRSFSKRGRAARRNYYQITNKGLNAIRRIIRSMLTNLIPVMYSFLENIKGRLFNKYKINRGDTILLYSYPIKQALIDLAGLVGDIGKVLINVNNELIRQTILDLAVFYNFENVIIPITVTNDFKLNCERGIADKAILLLFQREKDIDLLLNEVIKILKPNGKLFLISTKLNIFSETFLVFFDFFSFLEFFDGYTENELRDLCVKLGLNVEHSEDIKKLIIVESIKKDK